jgi:hypothetical protein
LLRAAVEAGEYATASEIVHGVTRLAIETATAAGKSQTASGIMGRRTGERISEASRF